MIKKLFILLSLTRGTDRNRLILLIFFLLLLSILETIGVGIIIPLLGILINEELVKNSEYGLIYYNFVENFSIVENSNNRMIIVSSIITIFFFFFKFLFIIFTTYFQQYFLFSFNQNLSERLIKSFANKDLNFHIKINSSEMISDLIEEVNETISVYSAYIIVFTEFVIFIFVSMILLYSIKLQGAGLLLLFSAVGYLILLFTKKQLINLGKIRQLYYSERFNSARDLFTSIKEIKILGVESFFIEKFNLNNKILNKTSVPKRVYTIIPRSVLEFVAVTAIFSILAFLTYKNENKVDETIFILGIFVAASVKLFPSISKIITSSQTIKFCDVALNKISQYLENKKLIIEDDKINSIDNINFEDEIVLKIKKFIYPETDKIILENKTIKIRKNQCIGIYGSSGIGKSTLVDIIMGLQPLDNKENLITVDKIDIGNSFKNWRKKFGYVGQNTYFLNDTIENNVAFGRSPANINHDLILDALKKANILDFINDFPKKTKSMLGEGGLNFSGGQRQRLGIARALYQDPEILVFDEATSSLDLKTEKLIMDTISLYKGFKTMIIISHRIENLSFCDEIIKLNDKN